MEKLAARAKKMVAGDPLDPKTRYGALASKKQLDTVQRYVDVAKTEGASLIAGGGRADIGTGKEFTTRQMRASARLGAAAVSGLLRR